ncbi:TonB-linked SusC/RagA family outer membrane protein [Arcticibacter pallidicorallinus]|uniref:TonB-linked SusC/RagA family outer membrane protein n=1 Tax=Arcticibacter pallidicorallinus TaxID=1259464 RepID=A0A2T0TWA5_9SPHI|nr:TonB-dependent receptor [Arcticibacter pallidicorallinus]PRY49947.1 TonB-linked SusC/RagA family outer membrane protein [Arcticibacter pallidicorallinus]
MRKLFTSLAACVLIILLFTGEAFSQNIVVKGRVTDVANGETLIGVSIKVKGAAQGTSTDANGAFTITVAPNATLVFTYIGFEPAEVPVNNQTTLTVTMKTSASALEEVVVVGYGTQRKSDVTGSVAKIKGADIASQPVLAATQAIQGRVAGVQIISSGDPNALPTVRIRGTGTMKGGANPLYVVDGIITEDIRNINNADIVSMDILKDASATAIYGMRAANGVLLITTKKGKQGKMVISYDAHTGVKEAANLVDMAGPAQYAGYLNEANVYYGSGDELITTDQIANGANTDWYDAILKKGFQQNHNLSLSGGTEDLTYFFSAGYLSDAGIIETNNFNRFTLRSNNEYNATKWLKLSSLISFSRLNNRGVDLGAFNVAYRAAPYIASKVNDLYGNTSLSNNVGNPLLSLEKVDNRTLGNRLQGSFALDVKPVSWLSLRSSFGVDLDFLRSTNYGYQFANVGANSVFLTEGGNQLRDKSDLTVISNNATKWVWDNTATFNKIFDKHSVNVLVGVTSEYYRFNGLEGKRVNVPADRDQWYLGAGSTTGATNNNTGDKWARNSYISRLNYAYDNRYLLTATFRADGTSRFPSSNRWGYFPSVGLGWNIAEEDFMKGQKTLTTFKIRGSWGKVGNDQINTNVYFPIAAINLPYFYDGVEYSGIAFDQLPDRNVKWETTEEYDLGLDYGFINNRLTGEIDYYHKKTTDALIDIRIPAILGDADALYTTNAATFTNRGLEFGIHWTDKINDNWSYNIGGNVSYNKNEITGLNGGQALVEGNIGGNQGNVTRSDNGQPIGSFYIYEATGIFQDAEEIAASAQKDARPGDLRYRDLGGPDGTPDGVINEFDRTYVGSYQPKYTFGINGSLTYKSFDLSINTYGTAGGKIYNGKKASRLDQRDNLEAAVVKNRWTPDRPSGTDPRANLAQLPASTYFLEKGDFFRINNLTLGYAVPKEKLSRFFIDRLRVFVAAQNLATITGYSGFTPEIISGNPLNAGIESNIYPTTRTFTFGVNIGL